MMRIDAFNHFFPAKYFEKLMAGGLPDLGKRMAELPAVHDLDHRRRIVGSFRDYKQIISLAAPSLEALSKGNPDLAAEYARIGNDGMAELCQRYPDEFCGFIAQTPLTARDAGVAETERAIKELGACGAQIYTNVAGKPVDRPEFRPFFAAMERLDMPIWTHPARAANFPDYLDEKKSLYEIWWAFGWAYETAAMMARLVFSKIMDEHPKLKVIVHHFGSIVPTLEGRVGPGWDQLGSRTSDEDYEALLRSLKKRPLEYFKHDFYPDTATFTSEGAMRLGFGFYDLDKVIFASDCPFDPEKGTMYIRETLRILDEYGMPEGDLAKVYHKNLERITGKTFVK